MRRDPTFHLHVSYTSRDNAHPYPRAPSRCFIATTVLRLIAILTLAAVPLRLYPRLMT